MILKVIFPDGTWIVGKRDWKHAWGFESETKGTHHMVVLDASDGFKGMGMVGKEVAVVISQVKLFQLDYVKEG